jgi:hypothetical protein
VAGRNALTAPSFTEHLSRIPVAHSNSVKMWEVWFDFVLLLGVAVLSARSRDEGEGPICAGDRYIYDTKDEITGQPSGTYVSVVTEVSDKEITTVVSFRGRNGHQFVVLDHDLNRIDDSIWKFNPNEFRASGCRSRGEAPALQHKRGNWLMSAESSSVAWT